MNAEIFVQHLRDNYKGWGWMGQRAYDAAAMNRVLPLDFLISCDNGVEMTHYFNEDNVFSLEKECGKRKDWSNEDLKASLDGTRGAAFLDGVQKEKGEVNIICYRSLKALEERSEKTGAGTRIFGVPEEMKRHFDNKVVLHRKLLDLDITRIEGREGVLGDDGFDHLKRELGFPFVIRFPYSSSGHFAFIIKEEKEYEKIVKEYSGAVVIKERYVDGFAVNVNAVIISTENGPKVISSFPSVQITGAPECGNSLTTFCGNDFTAAGDIDPGILKKITFTMQTIGEWMAQEGYRGIFGMDLIIKEDKVYPVEVNPRFQNSTSLYDMLRVEEGSTQAMFFLAHVAEFLQKEDMKAGEYIRGLNVEDFMRPVKGAQVILHNRLRKNIVEKTITPGIYRLEDSGLKFKKRAALLTDCKDAGDMLVTCGIPADGVEISPNAALCKIQMLKNAVDMNNKIEITPDIKHIISGVYKGFVFQQQVEGDLVGV